MAPFSVLRGSDCRIFWLSNLFINVLATRKVLEKSLNVVTPLETAESYVQICHEVSVSPQIIILSMKHVHCRLRLKKYCCGQQVCDGILS